MATMRDALTEEPRQADISQRGDNPEGNAQYSRYLECGRRVRSSSDVIARHGQPNIGNRIYHVNPDEPDSIKLKPANLADTSILEPQAHIWISEKQDWFKIPKGIGKS